ncbi:MAG: hypothetical protein V1808_00885 [Candidatus Daviesbacteria bacterium]
MDMKYKVSGAVASAALMLTLLVPKAFADSTLQISGNGNGSGNTITVVSGNTCDVTQKANTYVGVVLSATSSTGGNTANNNTGGTTDILSGNATATVNMTVTGGSNIANDPCCCQSPAPTSSPALISGNGNNSTNVISDVSTKDSSLKQKAKTKVGALVGTKAKTGKNKANGNLGSGTKIDTGNVTSSADLIVTGGTNTL